MNQPASDRPPARDEAPDLAAILDRLARAVERAADVLAARIAPALEQIAAGRREGPATDPRAAALAVLREALAGSRWEQARELVEDFARQYPSDPELEGLLDAIERGRAGHVEALHGRLEESRRAEDPDAVLGARDELARHLDESRLAVVDRDVLAWMLAFIKQRMRSGTVGLDVALWAGQVVDRYSGTPEGASLRAALPILRRCAGLCARCGSPYKGLEEACPRCLAAARAGEAAKSQAPADDATAEDEGATPDADEPS